MHDTIGTPLTHSALKVMLLGSGELGKEVAIECQRLGLEVIAVDRYEDAPAMQVAHRFYVLSMQDGAALLSVIGAERPHIVIPEIEAIDTEVLSQVEEAGIHVVPTARATQFTMNRERIRTLATEELGLLTSPYRFAGSLEELEAAAEAIGFPCVIKPIMSSSGKGQSLVKNRDELTEAWDYATTAGRVKDTRVIVEGFVDFDFEITLLTVQHSGGVTFCEPVGHKQIDGDYRESWQPQPMNQKALEKAQAMANAVTGALGGYGLFGVEFFVKGDEVYFSEVSPRPHDTGLVTLASQDLSEFALHVRAVLGLPVSDVGFRGPSASCAIVAEGEFHPPVYGGLHDALAVPTSKVFLFGKPVVEGYRRVGVAVARGTTVEEARERARQCAGGVSITG